MKIVSAQQSRDADAATIKSEQVESHELMERAGLAFTNAVLHDFTFRGVIYIVCGTGNNGGDGLCIARHLLLKGYDVKVFIAGDITKATKDFHLNYARLQRFNYNHFIELTTDNVETLAGALYYIDAIFGTGLNKPPDDLYKKIIEKINEQGGMVFSIDVPSGLFIDKPTLGPCISAAVTYTFQFPKLAFFLPENAAYIKEWKILDIGLTLPEEIHAEIDSEYVTKSRIKKLLHIRKRFDHKGTFGHSLIIAGNRGMEGAAALSGKSCLVTGSGLVTISSTNPEIHFYPELMHIHISETENIFGSGVQNRYQAVAIGPGLGKGAHTRKVIEMVFHQYKGHLVLDADALNTIAENKILLEKFPVHSILTPHPKEFERLFGTTNNSFEQLALQKTMSKKYQCIIVLKRAFTCITLPDGKAFFNSTGNPGMATAGSGDVLTGIITGLLAQNYEPAAAAITGTFLHGYAADLAMQKTQGQNIIATDIIENMQAAFSAFVNTGDPSLK
ncbi:MAG: NAD(P)H-hydrate dehydratase [Chitinophagales bacterium]|nr:NAD(P)H-hydrate dehydratase [Chitinophagales bacterium]